MLSLSIHSNFKMLQTFSIFSFSTLPDARYFACLSLMLALISLNLFEDTIFSSIYSFNICCSFDPIRDIICTCMHNYNVRFFSQYRFEMIQDVLRGCTRIRDIEKLLEFTWKLEFNKRNFISLNIG